MRSPGAPDGPGRAGRRYVLISPCRDEAAFLSRTVATVARQSILPARWVVVDDGSKDATPQLLAQHAAALPFLTVATRDNRGFRNVGGGVIEAFNVGLSAIDLDDYDYVCKLDMDLEMPEGYFAELMARMEANPRLGAFSGKPYYVDKKTGRQVVEHCGDDHVSGAVKFYRVACFREIGGFVQGLNWDAIDAHTSRMLGWKVGSTDDPKLLFLHLRPMGSSQVSMWHGRVRFGRAQWFIGAHPFYMLIVSLYRVGQRPYVTGAAAMLWGYVSSWLKGVPRYERPHFRRYLHRYQLEALVLGKRRAVARAEWRAEQAMAARARPIAGAEARRGAPGAS